jgi:ubiquinone/menaquinone biosynthesis C-methylase UbiE
MIATSSLVLHAIILTGFSLVDALALVLPQLIESNRVVVTRSTSLFHHRPPGSHDDRRCALRRIAIASASSIATATSTSTKANAITPQQASTSYDKYAANYNALDGGSIATSLGIDDARKQLLSQAYGNVLEIGAGTGLNLDSYRFVGDDSAITSLTLVDISEGMLSVAKAHAEEIQQQYRQRQLLSNNSSTNQLLPSIKFVKADATSELIPLFGENAFDTVVDTFSLCVMGNEGARKCLREMRGVVKKGGTSMYMLSVEYSI